MGPRQEHAVEAKHAVRGVRHDDGVGGEWEVAGAKVGIMRSEVRADVEQSKLARAFALLPHQCFSAARQQRVRETIDAKKQGYRKANKRR